MRFDFLIPVAGAALLLAGCAKTPPMSQVAAAPPPLASVTYSTLAPTDVRTLVVIVHDDLPEGTPVDRAALAQKAAAAVPSGASVVMLRPGYSAADGTRSEGTRDQGIGDGYGPEVIRKLGESIRSIETRFPNARTILMGEGGGAALVANLASSRPDLADAILLVDCPCTLPEWRKARAKRDKRFATPVDSLDPLQTAGGVMAGTRIAILSNDDRARFARPYAEALALRGIGTEFRKSGNPKQPTLDDPELTDMLARLAQPPRSDKDR